MEKLKVCNVLRQPKYDAKKYKSKISQYQEECSKEKSKAFKEYTAEKNDILNMPGLSQQEVTALLATLVKSYNKQVQEIQEKYRALINQ